jgi:hypothetical protein
MVGGKIYCPNDAALGAAPQVSKTNGLAITSLILGILSLPLDLFWCIGVPVGIAALVTGLMARNQINQSGGVQGGNGMAIAGMIMGGISGVVFGGAAVIMGILLLLGPVVGNVFSNIVQNL